MLIYLITIFSLYFIFLIALVLGWYRLATEIKQQPSEKKMVSVVVPFRNEADNLPAFVATLAKQSYTHFEVLFINDHSSDQSDKVLMNELIRYPSLQTRVIELVGEGKKQALTSGISYSTGEIILTTDADCSLPPVWIEIMVSFFDAETHMVVGAVKLKAHDFFSRLQALEFLSLMGSGLAMLRWGIPLMSNGASLGFTRKAFNAVNGYSGNEHIPSGDDEFLMHKIAKQFPGTVKPVTAFSSVVVTESTPNLSAFLQQRIRWASKWEANQSALSRLVAVLILLIQGSWLVLLITFPYHVSINSGALIGSKILLEFIFLMWVSKSVKQKFSLTSFLLLQILYPVYVLWVGVAARFMKYPWKGRIHAANAR